MPWVIEKRAADVHRQRFTATSETGNVAGKPVRGLLRAYLEVEASKSTGKTILSSLAKPLHSLACKITELLEEPFDTRAQYRLIEDSCTDTAVIAIVPGVRSRRSRRDSAYQQWRADTLRNGEREFDVEDLEPLPPSAGMDTRLRLKLQGLL